MARSSKGNLRGSAARAERAELSEFLYEKWLAEERDKRAREIIAENDAMFQCIALEGVDSFYRWWNDDKQVPARGLRCERMRLLEERIARLSGLDGRDDPAPTTTPDAPPISGFDTTRKSAGSTQPAKLEEGDGVVCVGNHADTIQRYLKSV